jgi:hypothetical protein
MGCTGEYNRHWGVYNERLVGRGSFLSDLSWIPRHRDEIDEMNHKKRGRPFVYGETLISYVSRLRAATGMTFRMLEGFLRPIFDAFVVIIPSYQTLWRRCDAHERIVAALHRDQGEHARTMDAGEVEGLQRDEDRGVREL